MTFNKISVLVPTRKRPHRLNSMLRSYCATVVSHGTSELIFRVDEDDLETQHMLTDAPWRVLVGPRMRGYESLPIFFNEMLQVMTGDVLMCGNDDMMFRTTDWPRTLLEHANNYPDGIFNFGVSTFNSGVFPFSVISKFAAEKMGFIHDPRIYWGDVFLRDVMASFGRALPLTDVIIDHDWAGASPDEVFEEAKQHDPRRWNQAYWDLHRQAVLDAVERLKA